eukprot:TRINITY_DN3826_c0_g1_i1.p1 TRINITY_DN3826_c0_g1~~TRINITY_DN3826_c0_g1_i1.p1  ORF type:complete len:151 (+),score=8.87 TRINITY_DN3826_c0_g1_i1:51-455(+)
MSLSDVMKRALEMRCCEHNLWDNVRVCKGRMTLRCRTCQKQWRVPVEMVWHGLRCASFDSGVCLTGDSCGKLHVFHRKVSLEERIKVHGPELIGQTHTAPTAKTSPTRAPATDTAVVARFTHNPYAWDSDLPPP